MEKILQSSPPEIVYVAAPYSHECPAVREERFELMSRYSAKLCRQGKLVLCGVSMCHPMVKYGLPGSWEYWQRLDTYLIRCCTHVHVLKLKGWTKSVGVEAEVKIAKEMGKPVEFIDEREV